MNNRMNNVNAILEGLKSNKKPDSEKKKSYIKKIEDVLKSFKDIDKKTLRKFVDLYKKDSSLCLNNLKISGKNKNLKFYIEDEPFFMKNANYKGDTSLVGQVELAITSLEYAINTLKGIESPKPNWKLPDLGHTYSSIKSVSNEKEWVDFANTLNSSNKAFSNYFKLEYDEGLNDALRL